MILSIGMIVKNEEKYLERCLAALQPILNELDSELIIADTGSTDSTVEIAKKFTDNVFYFEWINDFAAARNATLEKARGEWYMFIDADEIIRDCKDIIRFFKSGEYKKYNSATYVVRSYTDVSDESCFSDIRSQRLISTAKGVKFQGKIHETFTLFYEPIKYLDIIADHYGYLFRDKEAITELARKKNKRNLELLFNQIEDEHITERMPCVYREIADCYEILNERDKALEYLKLGLKKVDHHDIAITTYYCRLISLLFLQEEHHAVIDTAKEYLSPKVNPSRTKELASDCEICFYAGCAEYKLKNYSEAVSYFSSFFDAYKKYKRGKLNTPDLMYSVFSISPQNLKMAYDIFFRCCYQDKKFALAAEYAKAMPLEKYLDDRNFMITHLNIRVEMMDNVGYNKLDELYKQLDDFGKNHFLTQIRRRIFSTEPKNREVIIKKLSSLDGLCADLSKIYTEYFNNNNADVEKISAFLGKHGSENGEDMLYILLEKQEDIAPFLLTEDFFADRAVQIIMNFFPNGADLYENYNVTNISKDALINATTLYGWVIRRALENNRAISRLFKMYGELGVQWCEAFPNSLSTPGDIRAAMLVHKVVSAKETGNYNTFMNAVRELKGIVPNLIPIVDAYKEENKDTFNSAGVNPEFAKLAVQVKQNIRNLISAGSISDARALIKEYEEICPGDPDIAHFQQEINNTLQ